MHPSGKYFELQKVVSVQHNRLRTSCINSVLRITVLSGRTGLTNKDKFRKESEHRKKYHYKGDTGGCKKSTKND